MSDAVGYTKDECYFKFPGCKKTEAGYQRADDATGLYHDACESCARKPYPSKVGTDDLAPDTTKNSLAV